MAAYKPADFRASFAAAGVPASVTEVCVFVSPDAISYQLTGTPGVDIGRVRVDWPRFLRAVANQLEGKEA